MFDKITSRIIKLCYGLNQDFVEPVYNIQLSDFTLLFLFFFYFLTYIKTAITMKVIGGVYSGVSTSELDTLAAETAASMTTKHPDYGVLAARLAVSNLHKETEKCFSGM